jgi:hypothetical protein
LPYDPDEEKKRKKPRKRLPDACRAYGIEGWERVDKDSIAADIGVGNWRKYGREAVFDYCEEDVRMSVLLLRRMLRGYAGFSPIDVPRVLHWSNYSAKCIARIQARGIPIDTVLWNLVQENKRAVIGELLRRFDPSHSSDDPIYTAEGEWSYARFERWLPSAGILAWPRLDSGALDISGDAFRLMYHHPGIENLHALRDSVGFIAKARLPIGRDGRNRPSLFPLVPQQDATLTPNPLTTPTLACVVSSNSRPTPSEFIWTGARKRWALPLSAPVTRLSWRTTAAAMFTTRSHACAAKPMTPTQSIGRSTTTKCANV